MAFQVFNKKKKRERGVIDYISSLLKALDSDLLSAELYKCQELGADILKMLKLSTHCPVYHIQPPPSNSCFWHLPHYCLQMYLL